MSDLAKKSGNIHTSRRFQHIKSYHLGLKQLWGSGKEIRQLIPRIFVTKIFSWRLHQGASAVIDDFETTKSSLILSSDWFTPNIPLWHHNFSKAGLSSQDQISILEIGSWEGLSVVFFLSYFPNATIDSVDTWEGGDEHKGTEAVLSVEQRFDKNTALISSRVRKFKGTSDAFFHSNSGSAKYRVIYVDGSHRAEDVYNDSCNAFARLEIGGLLILDDLSWNFYDDVLDNPGAGINRFLKSHKGQYRVLYVSYQLYLVKTK
jgi:hypothetical protein